MGVMSTKAIDLIVSFEVSSPEWYNKKLTGISLPPGQSGATVGIGYDLGYQNAVSIKNDWLFDVGAGQCDILAMFAGLKGDKARNAVQSNPMAKQVSIPFIAAKNVFTKVSLPSYYRKALSIYPGLDKLAPDAVGAVVSLVYNRGTDLTGDRRTEMRALKDAIYAMDYKRMADLFRLMKRLWNNGLVQRREDEAKLIDGCNRPYDSKELIQLT